MAAPWRGKGNLCGSIDSGVTGHHAAGNSHVFTRVDGDTRGPPREWRYHSSLMSPNACT